MGQASIQKPLTGQRKTSTGQSKRRVDALGIRGGEAVWQAQRLVNMRLSSSRCTTPG